MHFSTLHKSFLFVVGVVVFAAAPALADGARLRGLGDPIFSLDTPTFDFPIPDVSFVPDHLDGHSFPHLLRQQPAGTSAGVDYIQGGTGSFYGVHNSSEGTPLAIGAVVTPQTDTSWVTGGLRGDLAGAVGSAEIDVDFATDARGDAGVAWGGGSDPNAPDPLAELMAALELGGLGIGGSVLFGQNTAADFTSDIDGTANSNTRIMSSSMLVAPKASVGLGGETFTIDVVSAFPIGTASVSYVSGAAAAVPTQDDNMEASNTAIGAAARLLFNGLEGKQVVATAGFASVPQNYSIQDDGAAVNNTVASVDDTAFLTYGLGAGVNKMLSPKLDVSMNGSFTTGSATFTDEAPGATPPARPQDTFSWTQFGFGGSLEQTIDLDGDKTLLVRGGVRGNLLWETHTDDVDAGGTDATNTTFNFAPSIAGGISLDILDPFVIDLTVNLNNFTGAAGGVQVPFVSVTAYAHL